MSVFVCRVLGVTWVTWGPWERGGTWVTWGPRERGRDLDDLEDLDARGECLCVGGVGEGSDLGAPGDLDKFRKFVWKH